MSDLIDRQAAIDAPVKMVSEGIEWIPVYHLKDLPSAQPQSTMGQINDTAQSTNDCISRQAAIDAILAVTGNSSVRELYEHVQEHGLSEMWSGGVNAAIDIIIAVPSAQPVLDRTKISDLLEKIYSIQSVHLSTEGVIAKKYYCKQLWMELFGSEDMPTWMD